MDKCKTLADYSYFIAEIRNNLKTMSLETAVTAAVDVCIQKDILRDFLIEQKAEVIAMSIYEYNEEYVKKVLHEEGMVTGSAKKLAENIESLMKNLSLDLPKACAALNITVEEYTNAKEKYYLQNNNSGEADS